MSKPSCRLLKQTGAILVLAVAASVAFAQEKTTTATAPDSRKPLRVLFMAHYGASGTLPHFEMIYEVNHPDRRVASWFQSSAIKADVSVEWEKRTCLNFFSRNHTSDKATGLEGGSSRDNGVSDDLELTKDLVPTNDMPLNPLDYIVTASGLPQWNSGLSGGERVSGDWAPNGKNRTLLQARLNEIVASGPDIVVLGVASDNSYLRGDRKANDAKRVEAINNYIVEIRKAGALPVVLMAPQGVRPPKDPKDEHPDEQYMVAMAASLDALAVPAGLAMSRIMRDQPLSFWFDQPAPEKVPDGWYRHPGKCDNYVSAAILAVALEDAKLAKPPDPEKINAIIANQAYGENAPTYTAEMLETMHTVAWEVWTEFKAKVASAKAAKKESKP